MTVPLSHYLKIKDYYCISYLGDNEEIKNKLLEYKSLMDEDLGLKIILSFDKNVKSLYGCLIKDEEDLKILLSE